MIDVNALDAAIAKLKEAQTDLRTAYGSVAADHDIPIQKANELSQYHNQAASLVQQLEQWKKTNAPPASAPAPK